MSFDRAGALASFLCAGTYLFGFAFLVTYLAPLGYGTREIDAQAVIAFIEANPGQMILWNSVIYILNALALAVLLMALCERQRPHAPAWAQAARAFGLIWATLVLGAGMVGNVAVEQATQLAPTEAAELWRILHSVELGLGGGNEIVGAVWIATVSLAGTLGRVPVVLGLITGAGGLLTLIPSLGDTAGAAFGLGAILWFLAVGLRLSRARPV